MRSITTFVLVVLTSCASENLPSTTQDVSTVADERHAGFAEDDFDACQLSTPEETWVYWNTVLSDEDRANVKSTPYGDLILFHHGWGTGIRNGLCLWKGGPLQSWFIERETSHPDGMSQTLITLYWAHLNGCSPQVDGFARAAYPRNPELLRCPPNVDTSVPDYLKTTPEIAPED